MDMNILNRILQGFQDAGSPFADFSPLTHGRKRPQSGAGLPVSVTPGVGTPAATAGTQVAQIPGPQGSSFFQNLRNGVSDNRSMLRMMGAGMFSEGFDGVAPYAVQGSQMDDERRASEEERAAEEQQRNMTATALMSRNPGMTMEEAQGLIASGAAGSVLAGGYNRSGSSSRADRYSILTAEEAATAGLPAGHYQRNETTGEIEPMDIPDPNAPGPLTPSQEEYDKVTGRNLAEGATEIRNQGRVSANAIGTLNRLESLASSEGFYTGVGAESVQTMRQIAAQFGVADPDSVSNFEEFRAQAYQMALDQMGGSLGAGFSNADRTFVEQQVPNIQSTPEGNLQLIESLRRVHERNVEISQMASQYAQQNGGRVDQRFYDEVLIPFAEANPLFPRPESREDDLPQPGADGVIDMTGFTY